MNSEYACKSLTRLVGQNSSLGLGLITRFNYYDTRSLDGLDQVAHSIKTQRKPQAAYCCNAESHFPPIVPRCLNKRLSDRGRSWSGSDRILMNIMLVFAKQRKRV